MVGRWTLKELSTRYGLRPGQRTRCRCLGLLLVDVEEDPNEQKDDYETH